MTAKSKNNEHIKIIPQPFNYSFTLMFEEYPEQFIEVLKAPGKFVKKANTQVKLPGQNWRNGLSVYCRPRLQNII